ncbi:MAG TPA: hypothetical protein VFN35_20935, partial [Ktedonobacteraceae bacterium]|nr:hypothetical protein [Ktedonobacteraceae bacterium]
LLHPPAGCRFHLRCPQAMDICRQRFPGRTNLGGEHWTHCFLYGEGEASPDNGSLITVKPKSKQGQESVSIQL